MDRSGRVRPGGDASAPAIPARGFTIDQIPGTDFSHAAQSVTVYGPGELIGAMPTTPAGMSRLLHADGRNPDTPASVQIDFLVGLAQWAYFDRDSRAATLRVLAGLDGLVYEGDTTDAAGRAGVAVSLTTTVAQVRLIFHRRTGVLLAAEQRVPGFVVDDYILFLNAERTPNPRGSVA